MLENIMKIRPSIVAKCRTLTLNHEHDTTWLLQFADHLIQTVSTNDLCSLCFIFKKVVHLRCCPIEGTDLS